ncbi:phosphotransferase enzyme family protein [Nonomuraea sp. NPDC048826]|uniref:phosphotransferase enzyme family protein n=1 Tax=Nonomuraea sp. NPDC048826 TaxID=3364347 RepID=UPI0037235BF9
MLRPDWVLEDFGLAVEQAVAVDGGADANALLWRVVAGDGQAYAVKFSRTGAVAGLELTARLDLPGVPRPLPARDGRPWSVREGWRLSVVPWVSDRPAFRSGLMTAERWRAYGRLLASVHAARAPVGLPRIGDLQAVVTGLAARVRPVDGPLLALWTRRDADAKVARLLDEAAGLAASLPPAPLVVSHGDPHLGNVLLDDDDGGVWLIDWDDAMLAPREWDLMLVLGLDFFGVTERERAWFLDGYAPEGEFDRDRFAYYRKARYLEDILLFAQQVRDGHDVDQAMAILREIL